MADIAVHQYQEPIEEMQETSRPSSPPADQSSSPIHLSIEDDAASLSGSAHHSSGPDEAVFDIPTRTSSPGTSNASSDDEISVLESSYTPSQRASGHFTPLKQRSPFRNPSSVRAMQLDTTPPHLTNSSKPARGKVFSHSRTTSTPRSARSQRGTPSKIMNSSPTRSIKREHPLVLLHVTLLPIPHEYTRSVLESVLPPTILANWELLVEKTCPTVLHRGVLIPHPREDYDLLEERLLESLELRQPRILKCGHFNLSAEEEADIGAYEDEDQDATDDKDGLNDADICKDCGRRIRNGDFGDAGAGSKRWDVKVFAANGLMRAGAWSAAWREMERVDVEILPWMEESMRRELEARSEEEEKLRKEEEAAQKEEGIGGLDDERLKEIYGQEGRSFIDSLGEDSPPSHSRQTPPEDPMTSQETAYSSQHHQPEIPLWDVLCNYLYLQAQDRRNIMIFLLSVFAVYLSMKANPSTSATSTAEDFNPAPVIMQTVPAIITEQTRDKETGFIAVPSIAPGPAAPAVITEQAGDISTISISIPRATPDVEAEVALVVNQDQVERTDIQRHTRDETKQATEQVIGGSELT